jgi:hypothetical protein
VKQLSDKQSIIEGLPALLIKQNQQVGEESIANITGDNMFCYLSFVEAYRGQSFQVKVIKVGHYPLRGVATDKISTGPEYDSQGFLVFLAAFNGTWTEQTMMKRLPGPYPVEPYSGIQHWSQATTVTGTGIKKTLSTIDHPDYPRAPSGDPLSFGIHKPN